MSIMIWKIMRRLPKPVLVRRFFLCSRGPRLIETQLTAAQSTAQPDPFC